MTINASRLLPEKTREANRNVSPLPPPIRIINEDYRIGGWFSKVTCKIFGHKMKSLTCDVSGTMTCIRCLHKEPGIVWPRS